ncbi:MAG: TRAFs-binding domain-containing protein [Rhodospirillaceae bacterium]|nr:TRAFs-binding domain-containing protein [Rhodospirillaceae bacterium]
MVNRKNLELAPDPLTAYDTAVGALRAAPDDVALKHRCVLLLARAGATEHARAEYARLGLDKVTGNEDVLALGGRILKDLSLAAEGDERRRLAALSAAKYAQAYALDNGYYPGINTATMFLLAGNEKMSQSIAKAVHDRLQTSPAPRDEDAYYVKATEAEAALLLRRVKGADAALAMAIMFDARNIAARATTLRQFETICAALGLDARWLDAHRPPKALHFCGHMVFVDDDIEAALNLTDAIKAKLAELEPGSGFGALAAGADILIAEALQARGAEVHVVLPFREDDFIAQSVVPFGQSWVKRYHAVRDKAASFRAASDEPYMGDDSVFAYGTEFAMGLAIRQAEAARTHAAQLAVWDGVDSQTIAGTAADVARWRGAGLAQTIIPCPRGLRRAGRASPKPVDPARAGRSLKAMLFGDVRGFSKVDESLVKNFIAHVMGPLADTVRAQPRAPELEATWGDGFHVVYAAIEDAAAAAMELQRRFSAIELATVGLPAHLSLRIGAHFGPVANLMDPFTLSTKFFGTHINIAARIEPVAVPGTVYVSEPFAAMLALRAKDRFITDYVGQTELPKDFGTMRLFALRDAGKI